MARMAIAAVSALMTWGAAGTASAVTMRATWTGWVSPGSVDLTGIFGGESLTGRRFELVFTYDPETSGAQRETSSVSDWAFGEASAGTVSPVLSAALTINGHTARFDTRPAGGINTGALGGGGSSIVHYSNWELTTGNTHTFSYIGAAANGVEGALPSSLDQPLALTHFSEAGWGNFSIGECVGGPCSLPDWKTYTSGTLRMSSVEIAPVPLPAALPLLASAVAALGFVGWRRRTAGA